jgi:DNA-binding transcriptional regulator YiaG
MTQDLKHGPRSAAPTTAQHVRDLLLQANLSQRAAARELRVDDRTMRYWCTGRRVPPRMALLALERLVDLNRQQPAVTAEPIVADGPPG